MRGFLSGAACLAAALFLTTAKAADCGAPDAPCALEDGIYHIQTPQSAGPYPAVMFLHGYGGRAEGTIRNRGFIGGLIKRGYAVIAPQGLPRRPGDKGGAWNSRDRGNGRNDVAYLATVAQDAAARHGIDRDRILLAGFSGGGMMAWRVACDAPGTFAAYAPIAGLLWRPLPAECAGPMRMQHTHGWSDPVVPLEGRTVGSGITQGNLFFGLDILRDANGCVKDKPDQFDKTGDYLIRRWTSCTEGTALEMALHPGGHAVPKGWSALALDWFEALP